MLSRQEIERRLKSARYGVENSSFGEWEGYKAELEALETLHQLTLFCEAALVLLDWKDEPQTWPEMGMYGARCGICGKWMTIVRPGKEQCDYCGWKETVDEAREWLGIDDE